MRGPFFAWYTALVNTKIILQNGLKPNSGHIIENGRDDNELTRRVRIFDVRSG